MAKKPRKPNEPIWTKLNAFIVTYPIILTAAALSIFSWFYFKRGDLLAAQTATFLTIGMSELYQSFTCRSTIYPVFKVGHFKNKYLLMAVGSSVAVIVIAIFVPSVGKYLDMAPLTVLEFFTITLIASAPSVSIEISKLLGKEGKILNPAAS